jgi:hypothetical protein
VNSDLILADATLILVARRLKKLLHEDSFLKKLSSAEDILQNSSFWLNQCSKQVDKDRSWGSIEYSINNFIESLKDVHVEFGKIYEDRGHVFKYSLPKWDVAPQKNNLNQKMNKDLASLNESRQRDWLKQYNKYGIPQAWDLYVDLSGCSERAKQVCHGLDILKEMVTLASLNLKIEYYSSFCAISKLLGEIESELLFLSELPIWERLREQEEADLIKNVSTDTPAFILNSVVPKSSIFNDL